MARVGRVRVLLTVGDQALSSAQNFALLLLTARAVPAPEFGVFSLVYAIAVLFTTLGEALVGEPVLLHFSAADRRTADAAAAAGRTLSILLGLTFGAGTASVAVCLGGVVGANLLALSWLIPGLIVFNFLRLSEITRREPVRLLALDASWVACWLAVIVIARPSSAEWQLAAWGLPTAAVALVYVGVSRAAFAPVRTSITLWVAELRRSAGSLLGEFVAANLSTQISAFAITGLLGYRATGGLRAAQGLLGPMSAFWNALRIAIVPEVIRSGGSRTRRGRALTWGAAVIGTVLAVAVSAALLQVPDAAGRALLGDTWPAARRILLPVCIARVAGGVALRALIALRADVRVGAIARSRSISAAGTIAVVVIFSALGSLQVTTWALAVVAVGQIVLFELVERRPSSAELRGVSHEPLVDA